MGANQKLRRRTVWLLIIILAVGFGAVITRLAFLQLVQGEDLQRRAIEQQLSDTPISAKRGTIYDTNMNPLQLLSLGEKALLSSQVEQLRLPIAGSFTDSGGMFYNVDYDKNHDAFVSFVYGK